MDENVEDLVQLWLEDLTPDSRAKVYIDGELVGTVSSIGATAALRHEGVYTVGNSANK